MTTLAIAPDRAAPSAVDPSLAAVLSRRYNGLMGGGVLSHDLALSPDQRLALKARAARLDESFRPAAERTALIAISGVLGTLSPRNPDPGDAATQRRAYWAALADVPGFALLRACAAALTKGVGDKRFAPTPPELREAALALAHPLRVERSRIAAVLNAEVAPAPSTPERRAEIAAAARRAFHIPEPGRSGPARPAPPPEPGELAEVARKLFLGSRSPGSDAARQPGDEAAA